MKTHKRFSKLVILAISLGLIIAGGVGLQLGTSTGSKLMNLVSLAGTVLGTVFIAVELMQNSNVTCSDLLIQQNNYFHDNESIMNVYKALEYELQHPNDKDKDKYLKELSITDLTAYCTFFENIYLLVNNNIASMSSLDDLFAYRFFLFMHSEYFQEKEILPVCSSYVQLFELYKIWYKYRIKKHTDHLIVSKQNKLSLEYINRKYYIQCERGFDRPLVYEYEHNGKTYKVYHEVYDYLDEIIDLQDDIYNSLKDKDLYSPVTREELIISMQMDKIFTIWDGDILAGFFVIVLNRDDHRNYVNYLNNKNIKFDEVLTFDSVVVNPSYWGQHMQDMAIKLVIDLCKKNNHQIKYIAATASPKNIHSVSNFEKNGFEHYIESISLYGGKERTVLVKRIDK